MQRIVADPKFNSSRRCVLLLRYLVEHALGEDLQGIKERTLGVEVFGREANYDSNADPVVRVTASEIRKRLARFYQESEGVHAVRIQLKAGNYLPGFEFESDSQREEAALSQEIAELLPEQTTASAQMEGLRMPVPAPRRRRLILWSVAAGLLLALLIAGLAASELFRSTDALVWKPFTSTSRELTVCVADRGAVGAAASSQLPTMLFAEATVAYKVSNRLTELGRLSMLRSASELTLREFRQKPVVLIGGMNNPWTPRLLANLRFSLHADPVSGDSWIQDAQNPTSRAWKVEGGQLPANVDYAVVTRVLDAETGTWVMDLAGLGPHGTEAAGDLITAPLLRKTLPDTLRTKKNFQIVLKTTILNEIIGPPRIVAVYVW